jgi:tetratricopeptide (TPR) repeat protein
LQQCPEPTLALLDSRGSAGLTCRLNQRGSAARSDPGGTIRDNNARALNFWTHEASVEFDRALALDARNDEARAGLGTALLLKGRIAEAMPDFDRALEIDPANTIALFGRAAGLLVTGQVDRAIVALDNYLARDKNNAVVYGLHGHAVLVKGDVDKAIADFDHALALQPGSADALTGRGLAWLKKRDYDRALEDLNRAIETGASIASYSARASVYEAQGKGDLAMADLHKAAELKPKSVFDAISQANARQRAQQLGKRLPCGSAGASTNNTCL